MPWMETFLLFAMLGAGWFWYDSFQAHEAGVGAARAACAAERLLFLDDTVALASLRPQRDGEGRLRLRRVYRFEYSDTGNNRRRGEVTLLGAELMLLHLPPPPPPRPVLRVVASSADEASEADERGAFGDASDASAPAAKFPRLPTDRC